MTSYLLRYAVFRLSGIYNKQTTAKERSSSTIILCVRGSGDVIKNREKRARAKALLTKCRTGRRFVINGFQLSVSGESRSDWWMVGPALLKQVPVFPCYPVSKPYCEVCIVHQRNFCCYIPRSSSSFCCWIGRRKKKETAAVGEWVDQKKASSQRCIQEKQSQKPKTVSLVLRFQGLVERRGS